MTSVSGLAGSHGLSRQTSTTGLLENLINQNKRYSSRKKTTSTASGSNDPMEEDDNDEEELIGDHNDSDDSMDVTFFPSWIVSVVYI